MVRVEHNETTDELYVVFQITNEDLKKRIKKNWMEDVEFKLIGKKLVKEE